jgi:carbon-monoxide dehydrogenase large subunit
MGDAARAAKAFDSAAHHVRLRLVNNRVTASPMEARGAIGLHSKADESFTLYSSTQNPHRVRETLARWVFGISESKLRVVGPDVGGGFGMKGDTYPEEGIVLAAARAIGRPVKWIAPRTDAFVLDNAGRDQSVDAEMALDADGRILAVRAHAMQNLGAYIVGAALVPLVYSLKLIPNVYDIPIVDLTTQAVFTHNCANQPIPRRRTPRGRICNRTPPRLGRGDAADGSNRNSQAKLHYKNGIPICVSNGPNI